MTDATDTIDAILDWDTRNQLARMTREAHALVRDSKEPTCGKCEWWMKSSDCPQERNVNGYSRGPSTSSTLARSCAKFERSKRSEEMTSLLEKRAAQTEAARSFADLPT